MPFNLQVHSTEVIKWITLLSEYILMTDYIYFDIHFNTQLLLYNT